MQTFSKFQEDIAKIPDQTPNLFPRNPMNTEVTKNGLCKQFIHGKCTRDKCQYSHDKTKMKPCFHFQNSSCTKGDDCDFSHMKETMDVCNYFQKGICNKEGCPFKHIIRPCRNYDKGFCEFGKKCVYTHVPKKLCINYLYGFCPEGPDCKNAHPKLFIESDEEFLKQFTGRNVIRCNECKEIGHKKTNCYFLQELPAVMEIYCTKCKVKHMSDECPLLK